MAALNFPTSPTLNDTYSNWIWKGTSWKNTSRILPNNTNTLDFPSSPSLNDVYTENGISWKWNGTSWKTTREETLLVDSYWSSVKLLLHGEDIGSPSGTIVDSSDDARTATVQGSAGDVELVTSQYKFGTSSIDFTGSGSSGLLYSAVGNEWNPLDGYADKTFECWVRFEAGSTDACIFYVGDTGWTHLGLYRDSFDKLQARDEFSGLKEVGGPINDETWYHVAVVINVPDGTFGSPTRRFYVDGVLTGIWRGYTNVAGGNDLYIGKWGTSWAGHQLIGQIDDFRVTQAARYPVPWTPSTSAFSDDASTSLLLHLNSTITDDSSNAHSLTTGGTAPTIASSGQKIGAGCLDFTAGNGYVLTPSNADFEFGTGDWTIEFWMISNGANGAGNWAGLVSLEQPSIVNGVLMLLSNAGTSTNCLNSYLRIGGAWTVLTAKSNGTLLNPNDNAWHHVALQRSGNFVGLWFDGVQTDGVQVSGSDEFGVSGRGFHLGYNQGDNAYFRGKLDEVRITKGLARYATSFTPPTVLPDQ